MTSIRFIVSITCLCLCGCVNKQPERDSESNASNAQIAEAIFFQAYRDFTQSGEIAPMQSGSMNWQILLLPTSVEQLIRHKDSALPMLNRLKTLLDPREAAFAEACISVMTAKHVHRGQTFTGKGNGIKIVAYTISN